MNLLIILIEIEVELMKDFDGKIVKLLLNANSGTVSTKGQFIKNEENFFVIRNERTHEIEYYNLNMIKTVSIVGVIEND